MSDNSMDCAAEQAAVELLPGHDMNAPDSTLNRYDRIFYPGHAYRQTHPDSLAAIATLLGMKPAPVDRCRVLELGCGHGANLIPMSWSLPDSRFVGIDIAANPIADGKKAIRDLELGNIVLERMDIMDFPESFGEFDYIIAHGLYSWVPPMVRDRLMAVCRKHLAENGVAFISYNTYPGCHIRKMVREMMLYHVHNAPDPQTKISQAQAILGFLADSQVASDEFGNLLRSELARVLNSPAGLLYHDDLADINHPVYFHQFIRHARAFDLQFLSEAEYFMTQTNQLPEQTRAVIDGMGDNILAKQQYMDFLRCRRFRQTLVCRGEVPVRHEVAAAQMADFYFSAPCRATIAEPDLADGVELEFHWGENTSRQTGNALVKAAFLALGQAWPEALHFDEILAKSLAMLSREPLDEDVSMLESLLQGSLDAGLVDIHVAPPRLAVEPGECPQAGPVARRQVLESDLVTTLRHRSVRLESATACLLLRYLDGTRNVADLAALLREAVADGTLDDREFTLSEGAAGEKEVSEILVQFGRLGLLVRSGRGR